jgi:hypothetical protein
MQKCKLVYFACGGRKSRLQNVSKTAGTKEYTQLAGEL